MVEVVFVDEKLFNESLKTFAKYEKLSFTDAVTLTVMRKFGIKEIFTHDTDFNLLNIVRKEGPP